MATLFRSPNIRIDNHEWHVAVETHRNRPYTTYRFRPVGPPARMWQSITAWEGKLPKGMWRFFRPYQHGIAVARGENPRKRAA